MARVNEMTDMAEVASVMIDSSSVLRGKKICITGHLGKTRGEIVKLIESAGGEFHDSIKWDTTHLLTNEDWNANTVHGRAGGKKVSSKFEKARRQGVKVINEKAFYDLLIAADSEDSRGVT